MSILNQISSKTLLFSGKSEAFLLAFQATICYIALL
jgi:hypothetical protein